MSKLGALQRMMALLVEKPRPKPRPPESDISRFFDEVLNAKPSVAEPFQDTLAAPYIHGEFRPSRFNYAEGGAISDEEYERRLRKLRPVSGGRRPEALNASRGVNAPLQLLRGWAAGTLGLPGDIEGLVRLLPGLDETPLLPTSDFYQEWLPGRDERPAARAIGGAGSLAGGAGATSVARGVQRVGRGALGVLDAALTPQSPLMRQRGAVRPRGGNFNEMRLDEYLGRDVAGAGAGIAGERTEPVTGWANKQLANYLRKDLGAPTDPLLAVEKELPNLHLPEGALDEARSSAAEVNRRPPGGARSRYIDAHRALTNEPLTAWGNYSDVTLESLGPQGYAAQLIPGAPFREVAEKHPWLGKAQPTDKIWALTDPNEDTLGFGHVLDYLDAATEAHGLPARYAEELGGRVDLARLPDEYRRAKKLEDAGLTLAPKSLERLSVADAVRKTAQWNELLANADVAVDGSLSKGWKEFKTYPDKGMRWVEFGAPKVADDATLPEGWKVVKGPGGYYVRQADDTIIPAQEIGGYSPTEQEAIRDALMGRERASLREGLQAEGAAMGHCVGGYCDDVLNRGTRIYSLRDAKGRPHVTVEVRGGKKLSDKDVPDDVRDQLAEQYGDASQEEFEAAVQQYVASRQIPDEIVQIKGKQNAAPVADYLPYVQDFVKSGKWGRVGDLRNTGLSQVHNSVNMPKGDFAPGFYTMEELTQKAMELGLDEYAARIFAEGNSSKRGNYAKGGSVTKNDDPPGFLPRDLAEWADYLERQA